MEPDPFSLHRFVDAQAGVYDTALSELRQGHKRTHWIWFVLPQLKALGKSHLAHFYGISGRAEARAYLLHPLLGQRLLECVRAVNQHTGQPADAILGAVDALKLRSCLTLFEAAAPDVPEFRQALVNFFKGQRCERTLALLAADAFMGNEVPRP